MHRPDLGPLLAVDHPVPPRGHHRYVTVVQVHHLACVLEHRGGVRRHEELAVAHTQQHRRTLAGHHDPVRLAPVHHGNTVCAFHPPERRNHPLLERGAGGILDQVSQDFRVGLCREGVAPPLERGPQSIRVLDDSVVNQRNVALAVRMGMGVNLRGRAVGGPAGVGYPADAVQRVLGQHLLQRAHPAGKLPGEQPAAVLHRDARRVIAAVFKTGETVNEDLCRIPVAGVAHYATHR